MTKKPKILIGPSSFGAQDNQPLQYLEDNGFEIVPNPYGRRYTKKEITHLLKNIDGLVAGLEPLDEDVISHSNLKVISRCGSGMNNVDMEAAKNSNVQVRNTPDGPTEAVAELTLGCLLSIMRFVPQMNSSLHEKVWDKRIGFQLAGKTLAIVGYGRIGRRLAELLAPFNLNLLVVDPYLNAEDVPDVTLCDLDAALKTADIISLHLAGDDCVLSKREFRKMKPGMILLNAARGTSVDEDSLINALEEKVVSTAWLDALPVEPYTGKLTEFDNVLLTPHVASYTKEGRLKMEMDTVINLVEAMKSA